MGRIHTPDDRPRMGPRLHITVPRAAFDRIVSAGWAALETEARSAGWPMETTDRAMAPADHATVYEGRPGQVWLASQGW